MAVDVFRYKNVMIIGKKNLITDVKGILVGNSHDDEVKTGVSVLTSDERFAASVSVLGGAPGTRETDLLESDKLVNKVDQSFSLVVLRLVLMLRQVWLSV